MWEGHPLAGVGAGNYARTYFQRRATTEDVEQPHSLELQTLSELGLVGALLLGALIVGVGWGAVRVRADARRWALSRALTVGGLGTCAAWLVQASVDWMQLLPGLTAFALIAAVVLVWPRARPVPEAQTAAETQAATVAQAAGRRLRSPFGARPAVVLGASAIVAALVVGGASLSRQGLADLYRSRAQSELQTNRAAALADVDRSLDIDADSVQSYYVQAAALARFGQAAPAESALAMALKREPANFVTWVLLGDIAVREGRVGEAKRYYTRAHQLNPRNATIGVLAGNPRAAQR